MREAKNESNGMPKILGICDFWFVSICDYFVYNIFRLVEFWYV